MFQLSTICRSSYEQTLSKYHGWLIRKCVAVAAHLLDSRDSFMRAITTKNGSVSEEQRKSLMDRLVIAIESVNSRVQHIYESCNLLELP